MTGSGIAPQTSKQILLLLGLRPFPLRSWILQYRAGRVWEYQDFGNLIKYENEPYGKWAVRSLVRALVIAYREQPRPRFSFEHLGT